MSAETMLTWDEILLDPPSVFENFEIYNQLPMSKFDSRFKVTLSRRRCNCLLHHSRWETSSSLIIKTLACSLKERQWPLSDVITDQNVIQCWACSCRNNAQRNQLTAGPNLPEDIIMEETEEMKTFFHNIFNGNNLGPGIQCIQRPLLDIIEEWAGKPDLQSYLFLRWVRNLITLALHYDIPIIEPVVEELEKDASESDLNSSGASVEESL